MAVSSTALITTSRAPWITEPSLGEVIVTVGGVSSTSTSSSGVVVLTLLETGDQLGTSSAVRRANQYSVPGDRPETLSLSVEPGEAGGGTPTGTEAAESKFESFSGPAVL